MTQRGNSVTKPKSPNQIKESKETKRKSSKGYIQIKYIRDPKGTDNKGEEKLVK